MFEAGRVSINRHGVIGTNEDGVAGPAADADNSPPAPMVMATAAPIAAHRDRDNDLVAAELIMPWTMPGPTGARECWR
jgi:hypothetical protein